MDHGAILIWNVHDLNSKSHRDAVRELVVVEKFQSFVSKRSNSMQYLPMMSCNV
jgi:hypothetical protein